ncbi:MAG: CYTH domain-containing protein [Bacillota bacterium]
MHTEWEATFWPVDKEDVRARLKAAGATLIYPERLMRRVPFHLHPDAPLKKAWARVRDEGDKITMSIKQSGDSIEEQKELEIEVSSFDDAVQMLRDLGCIERGYQETRRELWRLQGTDVTIDEWPHIEPLIEIEGVSEEMVRNAAETLGFDWNNAVFDSVDLFYSRKYGVERHALTLTSNPLTFHDPLPF